MISLAPRSTSTDPLFPSTTPFRTRNPLSASGRGKIGLQYLEQPRRALAAADAHRDDDIFRPAPFALDQRVAGHPRPRHAIGMADRDRAAVNVEQFVGEIGRAHV